MLFASLCGVSGYSGRSGYSAGRETKSVGSDKTLRLDSLEVFGPPAARRGGTSHLSPPVRAHNCIQPKPRQGAPRDTTKLGDLTRHNCNTSCYVVGELIAVGQSGGRRSVRGAERERQKSPTDTGSGPSQTPGRKWAFAQTNTRPGGPSGRKGGGHAHLLLKTCLVLEHFHRLLSNFPIFNMI